MNYEITKNDGALQYREFHALECDCFPDEPFNEIQFGNAIQGDYWTARASGELLGFANVSADAQRLHLSRLEVRSEFRKMGLGSLLIDEVIRFATRRNSPCVTLRVRTNNAPAYRLYLKKGFEVCGYQYRYEVPVHCLPDTASAELIQADEGGNAAVTFVRDGRVIAAGWYNHQIGGCKDFVLSAPRTELSGVLAALKARLKPGSLSVYVMTRDPETIGALRALPFAAQTEIADMKRAVCGGSAE